MKTVLKASVPGGTFWGDGNAVFNCMPIIRVYTYVKTDQAVHLGLAHLTVCKSHVWAQRVPACLPSITQEAGAACCFEATALTVPALLTGGPGHLPLRRPGHLVLSE